MKYIIILLLITSLTGCTKDHTQPTALATTAKIKAIVIDRNITVSAEDSYAGTGLRLVSYEWNIAGIRAQGEKAIVLANPGNLLIELTVTDDKGGRNVGYYSVTVK